MKIYFLETEPEEQEFFQETLSAHDLHFVDSLSEVARDAEIVSGFIHSQIGDSFLEDHPAVKLIATRSTTHDHIDIESCAKRHVTACKVESYGDTIVAEHAFALILALSRRLREAMKLTVSSHFSYESLRGFALKSKTLGIIGAGRVGLNVVPIAKGFGMRVIAYDIRQSPDSSYQLGFQYVGLDELLRRSDIISLHAALTPATYHILDAEAFAKCRPGVLIINTARGKLIDTDALIKALDEGVVGGAGLDVLGEERVLRHEAFDIIREEIVKQMQGIFAPHECRAGHPDRATHLGRLMRLGDLLQRPNVVFTPHTAFNCVEAIERIARTTVDNIDSFLAGEAINVISPASHRLAMTSQRLASPAPPEKNSGSD